MAVLGKIGKSMSGLLGRAGQAAPSALSLGAGSKTVLGLATAGAVIKGLSDTVGQSTIDNAMDIAFDNPQADRAVLGTDLTPGILMAEAGLPGISGLAKAANVDKYGLNTGIVAPMAGGGTIGAVAGGLFGASRGGSVRGRAIGRSCWSNWWRSSWFRSWSWRSCSWSW
jgi:hypothetical protein